MNFTEIKMNLEKLGYKVSCFDTAKEAADYMDVQIDKTTVGFGGSVTLKEMGLYEKLSTHNKVTWHWVLPEGKTSADICKESRKANVYISSVNGIAKTGEIINIDGTCNRVSEIYYGHEKVFLVAGVNKIADEYDSALYRARNIAAPLNAKRLNMNTPCAKEGNKCYNCNSPERICRGLSVLWGKPMNGEFEVVLINEKLGY